MKATQSTEPAFKPVILTLETQEEVDALYAFLAHSVLSDAVGLLARYQVLTPYRTRRYENHLETLNALLK